MRVSMATTPRLSRLRVRLSMGLSAGGGFGSAGLGGGGGSSRDGLPRRLGSWGRRSGRRRFRDRRGAFRQRVDGLDNLGPQRQLVGGGRAFALRHRRRSRGMSTTKRPRARMPPAMAPAASPEPKKTSPRAGPMIAEPVSCAHHQPAHGVASGNAVSTHTGEWKVCCRRSTARLRPAESGTLAAATGPCAGSATGASRKKM